MVNTPRRKLTGGRLESPSWGERKVPQEWPLGKGVDAICRRKMRMSGLCKVEMSAFMDGRGPYGNGADHFEPTRTGPVESVARGKPEASDAGLSRPAAESNRPSGAPDAASHSRTRGWCPGSRTAWSAIQPQIGGALRAEDSEAPTPTLCGFRTHAGRRTPGQGSFVASAVPAGEDCACLAGAQSQFRRVGDAG